MGAVLTTQEHRATVVERQMAALKAGSETPGLTDEGLTSGR
jgi:hypothetical protein